MDEKRQHSGFTDVDRSVNPQFFVACLDEQLARNRALRLNKQRTLELADIQEGHTVLDAGCGTGDDALQMAQLAGRSGQVIGVDLSQEMVAAARARSAASDLRVRYQQGSVYKLDFGEGTFDRVRCEKTFQHLSDPKKALQELLRVTRPGGKIIVADPDHDSLIIDTPFAEVNGRFARFRSESMAQGGIAHQMYGMFRELGLQEVTVEPLCRAYTDYEEKKVSSPYLEEIWMAQEKGAVTREEAEAWGAYLGDAIEGGRFLCLQTYVITTGIKAAG